LIFVRRITRKLTKSNGIETKDGHCAVFYSAFFAKAEFESLTDGEQAVLIAGAAAALTTWEVIVLAGGTLKLAVLIAVIIKCAS
jgi:hypothetical protein